MEREKGFEAGTIIKSALILATVAIIFFSGGCSKQFAKIEANQVQLKLMSQSNAEQLADIAEYIGQNQAELTEQLQKLHNEMQVALDNQQVLMVGLVVAHNEAAEISGNIASLENKQAELYNTVQGNNSRLNEKVALLEQNQSEIKEGIADSKNQTLKVSSEVAALGNTQTRLYEESQKSIQQVADNLSSVANSQETLKAGLVASNTTSAKIAEDVVVLGQKQSQLNSDVQNNNSKLNEKFASLEQNQNTIIAGITDSKNQTLKVSSEVAALGRKQTQLSSEVQSNNSKLNEKIASLEKGQSTIASGIADSKSQTLKLSSEVAALGDKQAKFEETSGNSFSDIANNLTLISGNQEILKAALVVAHNENAGAAKALSEINQNQEVLKAGLVVSHNETAGVGNQVTLLGETQKELKQIIQDSNTRLSQKVASLEKNQSDLLTGFDKFKSDTKQIAADFSALGSAQVNLKEAVDSYNKQLTERVAFVEKSQQDWQETIKQMQQSVEQAAGNISVFEQNLSKLQEIFQVKISDLSNASGAGVKVQLEFQEKIKNDLAALSEAVSVLKQGQSQMQLKIEEVQTSTKSMSVEFPAAIEQLKNNMDVKKETEYSTDK